ncbi:MAG: hypothetical protein PHS49_03320 [Candidatus Gracilibacteria bacterium]|nr:hypothetical protein [Candidatus Gracilibacteria bacterium]
MNLNNRNKKKTLHHNTHRLCRIRRIIESHGYDQLSEQDILYLSSEIENNKLSIDEVDKWRNQRI